MLKTTDAANEIEEFKKEFQVLVYVYIPPLQDLITFISLTLPKLKNIIVALCD